MARINTEKLKVREIPDGLKLHVRHFSDQDDMLRNNIVTVYGVPKYATRAELLDRDGMLVAQGVAKCSRYDEVNRKLGFTIAVNRAVKDYYRFLAAKNVVRAFNASHR